MAVINVFGLADVLWLAIKEGKQRVGKKKKEKRNGTVQDHREERMEDYVSTLHPH